MRIRSGWSSSHRSRPQASDQLGRIDAEGIGEPHQAVNSQVGLAPFDVPDVGAMQAGLVGQAFLGHQRHQGFAMLTDAATDLPGLL